MSEQCWAYGGSTTTPFGRTVALAICHQPITPSSAPRHRNGTGRCVATRPAPLQHRAEQAQMTNRPYSSPDEKRGPGQAASDRSTTLIATLCHGARRGYANRGPSTELPPNTRRRLAIEVDRRMLVTTSAGTFLPNY